MYLHLLHWWLFGWVDKASFPLYYSYYFSLSSILITPFSLPMTLQRVGVGVFEQNGESRVLSVASRTRKRRVYEGWYVSCVFSSVQQNFTRSYSSFFVLYHSISATSIALWCPSRRS